MGPDTSVSSSLFPCRKQHSSEHLWAPQSCLGAGGGEPELLGLREEVADIVFVLLGALQAGGVRQDPGTPIPEGSGLGWKRIQGKAAQRKGLLRVCKSLPDGQRRVGPASWNSVAGV